MFASRKLWFIFALGMATLLAGAAWAVVEYRNRPALPEYADAPFTKAPADFPRILLIAEYPNHKSQAEQTRYQSERAKVQKHLRQDGAIRRLTDAERKAYLTVLDANDNNLDGFVNARSQAQTILDADHNSVIGHFVMAKVQHYGEANFPRALFEIRQARKLLERRGQANPNDADAREWYILVLYEEFLILDSMDRREEQLKVVDLLDAVYQPMPWLRIFPLIKLQKANEAEAVIEAVDKEGTWPLRVVNSRAMIFEQRRDREGMYKVSKDMVQKIPYSAVLWSNFGGSCINDFRIDEAEAALLKSTTLHNDFNNSAFFGLSSVYVQKGQMKEAWKAVKSGQAQRGERESHTLEQDRTTAERAAALVLLAAGKGEEAVRYARRAFERPGRVGSTTNTDQDDTFSSGFLMWLALETRIAQIQEIGAPFSAGGEWELQSLRTESWALRQRLTKILGDEKFLRGLMRPYLPGQATVESWQLGSMLTFLPIGVAEEALEQARKEETHPAAVPYFDAMAAELALAAGRNDQAVSLARHALDKLPDPAERLLRGRVAAVAAEASYRAGRADDAHAFAQKALKDFPHAFRMLGFRIPVRVEDDGSEMARKVSHRLLASPRFRNDSAGFRIEVREKGDTLIVVMHRGNEVHVEADVKTTADKDKSVTDAVARFHERVMSPQIDLTIVEVNGVDQVSKAKK